MEGFLVLLLVFAVIIGIIYLIVFISAKIISKLPQSKSPSRIDELNKIWEEQDKKEYQKRLAAYQAEMTAKAAKNGGKVGFSDDWETRKRWGL